MKNMENISIDEKWRKLCELVSDLVDQLLKELDARREALDKGNKPDSQTRGQATYEFGARGPDISIVLVLRKRDDRDAGDLADRLYSDHLRNSSAPLVPPKPKEFDIAYSSLALRA
jgi:hypothetical protein